MDLNRKILAIWIPTTVASDTFNLPQTEEGWWIAVGEVAGESPIGIWFMIEWWERADGGRFSAEGHTYLIRWEWIKTARLFSELPKSSIGFQPLQPKGPTGREEQS
jgi:hypothetical protein